MTAAAIAVAGALGALARYGIGLLAGATGWPWPTLAINVVGSFLAGLLLEWATSRLSPVVGTAITVGFLGAFTTYSAFSVQVMTLVREGRPVVAGAYLVGSVALGLVAALAGLHLGDVLSRPGQ